MRLIEKQVFFLVVFSLGLSSSPVAGSVSSSDTTVPTSSQLVEIPSTVGDTADQSKIIGDVQSPSSPTIDSAPTEDNKKWRLFNPNSVRNIL